MQTRFIYLSAVLMTAASCSSVRPLFKAEKAVAPEKKDGRSRQLIDNVAINPAQHGSKRVYKDGLRSAPVKAVEMQDRRPGLTYTGNTENSHALQFKYAVTIDVPVEALTNLPFLQYVDDWYGTPYRYGGSGKQGIDCSAFSGGLLVSVFGITIPRTATDQYKYSRRINKDDLQEGDLVFFNTTGGISHVGVYLINNKFAHASVSNGVTISDLNDEYYKRRYIGAGRVID